MDPSPPDESARPPRLDLHAIEAKWRARWAERPRPSPLGPGGVEPLPASLAPAIPLPPLAGGAGQSADAAEDLETEEVEEDLEEDEEDEEESAALEDSAPAEPAEPPEDAAESAADDADDDADAAGESRPFYLLDMFPYPSARGFSVNQLRGIAVSDVVARYQRARGRLVFRPIGWDSFGVGIEHEALELGISPAEVVERGVRTMRDQLVRFGALVDWDAELRTSDPGYYRFTQWLFLKLRERGLAVREEIPMKWCSGCRMNIANEEVSEGTCVHCGGTVDERAIPQWKVRITGFGDRLHHGLRTLKWPPRVKTLQRNWIGRREGFLVTLKAKSEFQEESEEFQVFTRRLESLADCTFVILAPEHPVVDRILDPLYADELAEYRERTRRRTERERLAAQGHPEGVSTGAWAMNPVTLAPMPIWVSASLLPSIRRGAILAEPQSDARQRAFAEHFRILQRAGAATEERGGRRRRRGGRPRRGAEGASPEVRRRTRAGLESRGLLEPKTEFHMRDWIFARQRYWGEPIPVVHCAACGEVPVPEDQLPVELPILDRAPATREGGSPLAGIPAFVATTCPRCGGAAKRETDTMPQWVASCWYYLRYLSPKDERIFDPEIGRRWLPVNLCVGGIEHAILHLLYVRFFSYFFHDLGLTAREEPFRRLFNQGRIRAPGEDAARAPAAHRGPRVLAAEHLDRWGADALRLHLLFIAPPSDDVEWDEKGLRGCARFLARAHEAIRARRGRGRFVSRRVLVLKHRLVRRVTRAIRTFHLNKAISAFMAFVRELRAPDLTMDEVDRETLRTFVILLAPFAPHIAAELWEELGETSALEDEPWPDYSEELLRPLEVEIAIFVDDRIVDRMTIDPSLGKTELLQQVERRPKVIERTGGRRAERVVVVPDRLVRFVFTPARRPAPAAPPAPEGHPPAAAPTAVDVPASSGPAPDPAP